MSTKVEANIPWSRSEERTYTREERNKKRSSSFFKRFSPLKMLDMPLTKDVTNQ